jgi:hypothetical protein
MKRKVCDSSDAVLQTVVELYSRWGAIQGKADRLRDGFFGLPVRDSRGREGRIYRISTQGVFVGFDGVPLEEKMSPEQLEMLRSS